MGRPPRNLPDKESPPRALPQPDDVVQATKSILAPLIQLLLVTGTDYTRLAAELKPLFIEQARLELLRAGRKGTDSAISLLSGVHRKDVRQWRESGLGESLSRKAPPSTQLYARWLHDPDYLDRRRRPKALPRLGPAPSFESLARAITRDVRPYTLLAELMRLGLVHVETRRGQEYVVPSPSGFVPPAGSRELTELYGANVSDHAAAAVANLLGEEPRVEQSVFADGINAESAELLSQLARRLWNRARAEMIAEASRLYEQDQDKPEATHRMRFGVYFHDESVTPDSDKPSEGDHSGDEN